MFLSHLLSIYTNKGSGPDYIHPFILKNCASSLARLFYSLFSFSLHSGKFPARWKSSYISPIFISGSRTMVENYRGIAILPTLGKLFESIVCFIITKRVSVIKDVVLQRICWNSPILQLMSLSLAIN